MLSTDRRVGRARVLEIQRPLHRRKIVVLDRHAADRQPARRVGVDERVLRSAGRRASASRASTFHVFSNIGRGLAVVGERERRIGR